MHIELSLGFGVLGFLRGGERLGMRKVEFDQDVILGEFLELGLIKTSLWSMMQ